MMCFPAHQCMAPPHEYMASSSDTRDSEEEENHNTWNMLLDLLTLPGSSPEIQQGLTRLGVMQGGIVMPLRVGRYIWSMEW